MDELKVLIEEKKLEYAELDNQVKWELMKFEIRKFAMKYSKKVAREKKRVLNENENLIKNFETKARDEHLISDDIYKKAKQDTELYYLEKTQGCIFRSKCQTYEEGEKSTKFFLGLEKKIAINGTIDMLKLEDDTEVNNYNDVLSEIKRFYKNLFSKKD